MCSLLIQYHNNCDQSKFSLMINHFNKEIEVDLRGKHPQYKTVYS
jgi:hypothetical protein